MVRPTSDQQGPEARSERRSSSPENPTHRRPAGAAAGDIAGILCPRCRLWDNGPTDLYCSSCGKLLLQISLTPSELILISGLAPRQDLRLANDGGRDVTAVLVTESPLPAVVFEHQEVRIPAGGQTLVSFRLDEQNVSDLPVQTVRCFCKIDGDPHKLVPFTVTVRSGPRPELTTSKLHFGEIREGSSAMRQLDLANSGGTPLTVIAIEVMGSPRLRLGAAITLPQRVEPKGILAFQIVWDASVESSEDLAGAGIRLRFGNYPESLFVPAEAHVFRFALEVSRPLIEITSALVKQDYIERIELENRGTLDIEVTSIESDQRWIEIASRSATFTLRCPESRQERPKGPTIFDRFQFDVICHPQGLAAGPHAGKVTILTSGREERNIEIQIYVVHPQEFQGYIGIDFGTSNSVIAFYDDRRTLKLVEVPAGEHETSALIPSVLTFVAGGRSDGPLTYSIGYEARNEAASAPERTVRSIKRIMGYDSHREILGRKFTPVELASLIIRKLVQLAEAGYYQTTGRYVEVKRAIVTVPANFFGTQIEGILDACEAAGLETRKPAASGAPASREGGQEFGAGIILDEPSAAALHFLSYLSEKQGRHVDLERAIEREKGLLLLVFDYGGGTLDVSVVHVENQKTGIGLRVLANMGNNRIGGDSIDLLLMRELVRRCYQPPASDAAIFTEAYRELEIRRRRESWLESTWRDVLGARNTWRDTAEMVKLRLTTEESFQVEIPAAAILRIEKGLAKPAKNNFATPVRRADLEALIKGTLLQCRDLVVAALDLAGVLPGAVDYVLHTGRQSLMPAIRRQVAAVLPDLLPANDILDPDELKVCVAKGAALYGRKKRGLQDRQRRVTFLSEGKLPHSYGVEREAEFRGLMFDEIIPRGALIPGSWPKSYSEEMIDESGRLDLKFYQNQGKDKQIAGNPDITLIGEISIDTLDDGTPGCDVRLTIDTNRQLVVLADGKPVKLRPLPIEGDEGWMG